MYQLISSDNVAQLISSDISLQVVPSTLFGMSSSNATLISSNHFIDVMIFILERVRETLTWFLYEKQELKYLIIYFIIYMYIYLYENKFTKTPHLLLLDLKNMRMWHQHTSRDANVFSLFHTSLLTKHCNKSHWILTTSQSRFIRNLRTWCHSI